MFEKVNPAHPDKVADRIAGAIVDLAYSVEENPRVAVEVMIGHGHCTVVAETSSPIDESWVQDAVNRISGSSQELHYINPPQDARLASNQSHGLRCGDNGIFKGMPVTPEQTALADIARRIYGKYPTDGKYILSGERLIICQSCASDSALRAGWPSAIVNPLGPWTGGPDVDTGCTNRKLGSDMADSVTGGGLHGKDLSKADVSVNIYAWLEAQRTGKPVELACAIGDETVGGVPFHKIVEVARDFILKAGGFEKFAEWGLI